MSDLSVEIENIPSSSIKGSAIERGKSQTSAPHVWRRTRGVHSGRPTDGGIGRLDDRFQLVAGAVPSDKNNVKLSAQDLGIASDRACLSYAEMLEAERRKIGLHRSCFSRYLQSCSF